MATGSVIVPVQSSHPCIPTIFPHVTCSSTLKLEAVGSSKHWFLSTKPHCITSQKTVILRYLHICYRSYGFVFLSFQCYQGGWLATWQSAEPFFPLWTQKQGSYLLVTMSCQVWRATSGWLQNITVAISWLAMDPMWASVWAGSWCVETQVGDQPLDPTWFLLWVLPDK
jgi:hypothetical protein